MLFKNSEEIYLKYLFVIVVAIGTKKLIPINVEIVIHQI